MGAARGGGCVIAIAPAAGAEAVEGLTFSLTLAAGLTFVVSWGLLLGWNNTFGPLLEGLANALKINVWRVHVDPAGKLRDLDHLVVGALQASIEASDLAMGYWFHQSARLQGWIGDEVWKLSRDTYSFGQWLVHTYVPTYVHGLTDVLHGATSTLTKTVTRVERVTVHVTKIIRVEAKSAANQAVHTAAKAVPIALAPPLAIPRLWHGIDELRAKFPSITKRLGRVEALLGAAAMAVAMANVLGVSARCLRSGNIGKTARRLCGLDTALLEGLLGGLIVLEGGFSVRELAQGLLDVEDELVAGISLLVTELNDLAA